jgi:two-component system, NtrC family, response regulator AtoC
MSSTNHKPAVPDDPEVEVNDGAEIGVPPIRARALVIEDDPHALSAMGTLIERAGFTVQTAANLASARGALEGDPPDLVVMDLMLPDGDGMSLIREFEGAPPPHIVVVTGHATVDTAVEALRGGAADYLTKPIDIQRLKAILAHVLRARELEVEVGALRAQLRKLGCFGPLVGVSPPMQRVYDLLGRVAPTEATVLITGETGTGKDLTADAVHHFSRRRRGPFLALNCGAVSPNLIESELFGHERGSFTGADRIHRGYFERASGGTLFLDEIAEMPNELQVKLLRLLETGEITRIGGERSIAVDVRVIAATNRVPEQAVKDGKLREDLLYRLKVFPIQIPALRERAGDIELLAQHFLDQLNQADGETKKLSPEAMAVIRMHHWPGNVRELKNVIHRAFIMAEGTIAPEYLSLERQEIAGAELPAEDGDLRIRVGSSIADVERRLILATLHETHGDKRRAATMLGVSLKTLYNRLHTYDVPPASEAVMAAAANGDERSRALPPAI